VNIIALDPGYGNVKVCFNGKTTLVQTAVSRPKDIGLAGIGMKTAARGTHNVLFNGYRFCVGPYSWYRGDTTTSMDYSSIVSPERLAAFYTAYALTEPPTQLGDTSMVIGLPVPLLRDETQATLVVESLRGIKREHAFTVDDKDYSFNVVSIRKAAQPVGAYINWFLTDELKPRAGGKGSEVAVLDIGMNTLDLYVILDGQVAETYVGGAEVGVKRVLQMLAPNGHDITELDARLRSGHLKIAPNILDAWIGELLSSIKTTMPDLKRFDVVIPVGGGVVVAGDKFRSALLSKGAKLEWSDDPVTENVRGLYKWGRRHA